MIDYIYQNGLHYDQLFPTANQDLPFWLKQVQRYGGPVLELACGTGRISLSLAQAGFVVTGIDNSPAMLKEAKHKASVQGIEVTWVEADIRDFVLDEEFALIIFPANAVCHLLNLQDFERCMECVCHHLSDNGKFVIDVFVPKLELLVNQTEARSRFSEYEDPEGRGRVVVTESSHYEQDTQIKRVKTYHAVGEEKEIEGGLSLKMYYPQELEALLKYNGFKVEAKYGGYDGEAFDGEAEKQLIICSSRK